LACLTLALGKLRQPNVCRSLFYVIILDGAAATTTAATAAWMNFFTDELIGTGYKLLAGL